jgi:hypothetical protein
VIVKLKLARETPILRREIDHPLVYLYEEPGDLGLINVFPHSLRWKVNKELATSILDYSYTPRGESSSRGFNLCEEMSAVSTRTLTLLREAADEKPHTLHALVPTTLLTQGTQRSFVGFIAKNLVKGQAKNPSTGDLVLRVNREDLPSPPCALCPKVLEMLDGQCSFFTYPKCVAALTVAVSPYFGSR